MRNYFIICSFLINSVTLIAQDSHYDRLRNLNQTWIRQNEDAWIFYREDLSMNDYKVAFELYKDSLIVYEEEDNATGYGTKYIESYFRIDKLTNEEFVIHPLNVTAVSLVDAEAIYIRNKSARKAIYKTYLSELKSAGKDEMKRKAILSKYKKQYRLDVDQISFKPQNFFFEPVKIDSVDVSMTWEVSIDETKIRTEYNDLRWIFADNSYLFGYRFEDRKIDPKVLSFLPPVVMKDDEFGDKETPQDSLFRILNEAPAGWYTGKFASEGFATLQKSLQTYGVNKPHESGIKAGFKYAVRIYHQGKFTDYYRHDGEEEPYLLADFFAFLDSWAAYVRTFEKAQKTILFPIAVKKVMK